jgi:histidinol-phosphatase (PHP family)
VKPFDNHVHTRWSWDTANTSTMELACERARDLGLPGLAFTEHVDFTSWGDGDESRLGTVGPRPRVAPMNVEGYLADLARCRDLYPELRLLSGIEAGEPHLFAGSVAAVLAAGDFQRVLGSLHAIEYEGSLEYVDSALFAAVDPHALMRRYLTDMLDLIGSSSPFNVLAHCDYPRRYWPTGTAGDYSEADFEEEYRAVFRALASSGRALEINTRSPLASVELMRWWWQEGGDAVSFGSDAHTPGRVGDKFDVAVNIVESAGFRPGRDRLDFWRR